MTRITTKKQDSQYRNTKLTNYQDHLNARGGVTSVARPVAAKKYTWESSLEKNQKIVHQKLWVPWFPNVIPTKVPSNQKDFRQQKIWRNVIPTETNMYGAL